MTNRISTIAERWLEGVVVSIVGVASRAVIWPRPYKRAFVMLGDAALCVLAVSLAFSLRLDQWRAVDWAVERFTLSMLAIWFPVAWYQGVYNSIFRYTGRGAIVSLGVAVAITGVPLVVFYTFFPYPGVPRTIAVLAPLFFLMLMTTARIMGRYVLIDLFHSRPVDGTEVRRTLIYGAGSLGQRLAASLAAEKGMRLVGYVDDDEAKRHQRLDGVKVFHTSDLAEVITRTGATHVLLAMSDISRRRKQEIVDEINRFPVEVQALPPMRELLVGSVTVDDLRPIQVEDLLGRTPVAPDEQLLARSVTGKRVLVTGAGGSIGSEICRQALQLRPAELILVESNEFALFEITRELNASAAALDEADRPRIASRLLNVVDITAVERVFAEHAPQTVYHAAAYKHVPLVEENLVAGVENNVLGTFNTAHAAREAKTERFILISTDKAVRPPNAMGASKRVCELILQAMDAEGGDTIYAMVRFGNVLGSSGSVVPLFNAQIARGGPVTVTHREVTRYFMTIPEAAQLVIQAAGMAEGGEVFVLDMGEPVKIMDLARSMIRLAGLTIREPGNERGDIEIAEIGLRQGEKLYEELLIGEDPLPTSHPRIMRARESFLPMVELTGKLSAIKRTINQGDARACRTLLRGLVPTLAAVSKLDRGAAPVVAQQREARRVAVPNAANGQS